MRLEPIPLPPGLRIGMRVVTNAHYLKVYRRSKPSQGTVINGTRVGGEVLVQLDSQKTPHPLPRSLFDLLL